eukprot:TRINITY_DN14988_c0_g1_i1.p1 TRINITY_DN14988_c0_g1~~TRINITY_DN14988_c0_g1_i1.p1  ORF type:complete len:361 (+),score=52.91 TRINITY_DN14988_c0_g1_i1:207-1289(+)
MPNIVAKHPGTRSTELKIPPQPAYVLFGSLSIVIVAILMWKMMRGKRLMRSTSGRVGSPKRRPLFQGSTQDGQSSFSIPQQGNQKRVLPIFDVDDTIKSSGNYNIFGYALGGVDSQYGRGSIYPGVTQFAFELSRSFLPQGETPAPVAILTARPKELGTTFKLSHHHAVVKSFSDTGAQHGYPGWGIGIDKGTVLYGSVREWVKAEDRGLRKFNNFRDHLIEHAHPEVGSKTRNSYVLVGDTGDLDIHCGELMLENYPKDVLAVFMHCVGPESSVKIPLDETCNGRPILYFRTYPGAARKAYLHKRLDAAAMLRVCDAAISDLEANTSHQNCDKWEDIKRDVSLCRVLAQNQQLIKPYNT